MNDNQLATALRNPDDEKGIEIEEDDGSPRNHHYFHLLLLNLLK